MSDGTKTTEGVWPEPADLSDQPTIASEPHADSATAEYPPFAGDETSPELAGSGPEEDGEDEWPVRTPAKGIRLGIPAALMLAVVLVALGFWGGAIAQKNHATASAGNGAAAFAARLRNAASGATGATGTSGAGGFRFPGGAGHERFGCHHRNDLRRRRQDRLHPHRDQPAGEGHAHPLDDGHPERKGRSHSASARRHGRRPGRHRKRRGRSGVLRCGDRKRGELDGGRLPRRVRRRRLHTGRSRRRAGQGTPGG